MTPQNYDEGLVPLAEFLHEQQQKLLKLTDEGLDEHSPEAVFGDEN